MDDITIKYLASLADKLSKQSETVDAEQIKQLEGDLSVAALWILLNPDVAMPANTVCAINFDYATPASLVKQGDELAFFPPVTGG